MTDRKPRLELEALLISTIDELRQLHAELRALHSQSPAFEQSLLVGLRKTVIKQEATSADLIALLRELHHDLLWLRKHISELYDRLGLVITPDSVPITNPDDKKDDNK